MIKITIEQTITEKVEVVKNFTTKKTPTEIVEEDNNYGGRSTKRVQFIEESAPMQVTEERSRKITLLEQEIDDDSQFNLKAVIATINGIGTR
jgi:hypothetical protein